LQRINVNVFKDPVALMQNVERVTTHLAAQVAGEPDSGRRVLTLIPARDGRNWYVDPEGGYWRAYYFVSNASSYDAVESIAQAFQSGKAFGQFQHDLASLPAPARYHPGFSPHAETVSDTGKGHCRRRCGPRNPGQAGD
jgi:hypothetical protein